MPETSARASGRMTRRCRYLGESELDGEERQLIWAGMEGLLASGAVRYARPTDKPEGHNSCRARLPAITMIWRECHSSHGHIHTLS